eukprot:IDg21678t1
MAGVFEHEQSMKADPPLERFLDSMERKWQSVVLFLNRRPDEPFYYSTRGRIIFECITTTMLLGLCGFTSHWQIHAGLEYNRRLCKTTNHASAVRGVLAGAYGATSLVHFSILIISSVRFNVVFPFRKLNFSKYRRKIIDPHPNIQRIPVSMRLLSPTISALREAVSAAKRGEGPPYAATQFLLSQSGRRFLNRALNRMRGKLQLYDDVLVRVDRKSTTFSFWLVTQICVTSSMAAAYVEVSDCSVRLLIIAFLDKFSFTLLAVLAVAAFSGVAEYSQIVCLKESLCRLTNDEKFLISLIAANTEEPFTGFARSESSGYVNIEREGDKEVFMPMHMSLFAYKKARTNSEGECRLYDPKANDCPGNYDLS